MSGLRLRHFLLSLITVRTHAPRPTPYTPGRELRLLQRRLAAARLGVSWARPAVQESLYEDLR
jgi:hypothetical protein